jgi:small acid-soluble spore protein H (minor)
MMNIQRAQEISQSSKKTTVTHNGKNVYIQHVDQNSGTARVFPVDKPEHEATVSVHELQEEM